MISGSGKRYNIKIDEWRNFFTPWTKNNLILGCFQILLLSRFSLLHLGILLKVYKHIYWVVRFAVFTHSGEVWVWVVANSVQKWCCSSKIWGNFFQFITQIGKVCTVVNDLIHTCNENCISLILDYYYIRFAKFCILAKITNM